jgi:hypothetical protein
MLYLFRPVQNVKRFLAETLNSETLIVTTVPLSLFFLRLNTTQNITTDPWKCSVLRLGKGELEIEHTQKKRRAPKFVNRKQSFELSQIAKNVITARI